MLPFPCGDELYFFNNGWVFAKWNTLSNVGYIFGSFLGMVHVHNYPLKQRLLSNQDIFWLNVLFFLIGCSSIIYHSSLQYWSIGLDFFSIELFSLSLFALISKGSPLKVFLICFFTFTLTSSLIILSSLNQNYNVYLDVIYNFLICILFIGNLFYLYKHYKIYQNLINTLHGLEKKRELVYYYKCGKNLKISLLLFLFAFLFFFSVDVYCPQRKKTLWYQMHSYWHLLSSISLYFLITSLTFFPQELRTFEGR